MSGTGKNEEDITSLGREERVLRRREQHNVVQGEAQSLSHGSLSSLKGMASSVSLGYG